MCRKKFQNFKPLLLYHKYRFSLSISYVHKKKKKTYFEKTIFSDSRIKSDQLSRLRWGLLDKLKFFFFGIFVTNS